jgi:hypothetical protein
VSYCVQDTVVRILRVKEKAVLWIIYLCLTTYLIVPDYTVGLFICTIVSFFGGKCTPDYVHKECHTRLLSKFFYLFLNNFISCYCFFFTCPISITGELLSSRSSSFAPFNHFKPLRVSFSSFLFSLRISPTQN